MASLLKAVTNPEEAGKPSLQQELDRFSQTEPEHVFYLCWFVFDASSEDGNVRKAAELRLAAVLSNTAFPLSPEQARFFLGFFLSQFGNTSTEKADAAADALCALIRRGGSFLLVFLHSYYLSLLSLLSLFPQNADRSQKT